jgi:hypothetical protein
MREQRDALAGERRTQSGISKQAINAEFHKDLRSIAKLSG